jgi:hypothetical protein
MSEEKKSAKGAAPKDVMGFLDYYLVEKAPFQLPDGVKEWIVQFGPWITLVILILSLPAVLLVLGLSALVFVPAAATGQAGGLTFAVMALIVQLLLMGAAIPGLMKRSMSGWNLVFYSEVLNLVYSVLSGSIVSGIISTVIGLYILFQIRSYYK